MYSCLCGSGNQTLPQHHRRNHIPSTKISPNFPPTQQPPIPQTHESKTESKNPETSLNPNRPASQNIGRRSSITDPSSTRIFKAPKKYPDKIESYQNTDGKPSEETKNESSSDDEITIRAVRPISTKFSNLTDSPSKTKQMKPFSTTPTPPEEIKEERASIESLEITLDFGETTKEFEKTTYRNIKTDDEALQNKIREFQKNYDYDNLKKMITYLLEDLEAAKSYREDRENKRNTKSLSEKKYNKFILQAITSEPNRSTEHLGNYHVLYHCIQDSELHKKLLEHVKFDKATKEKITEELQRLDWDDTFKGKVTSLLFFTSIRNQNVLEIITKEISECHTNIETAIDKLKKQIDKIYENNTLKLYSEEAFEATKKLQKLVRNYSGIMTL